MSPEKKEAFEYFVHNLIKWWSEQNPNKEWEENDLSVMKVMLLLFFTCSADHNTIPRTKEDAMLDIFDNFRACAYGHFEWDVYTYIRENKGAFSFFTIGRRIILTDYSKWLP